MALNPEKTTTAAKLNAMLKPKLEEPEENLTLDATQEEIAAGRVVNNIWAQRAEAEAQAGRKLVALNQARQRRATNSESKE
jgi:hypothetical protein